MIRSLRFSMKISHKIILGFSLILILTLVNGALAYNALKNVTSTIQQFYDHPFTVAVTAERARVNITAMHRAMKDVALAANEDEVKTAIAQIDHYENRVYEHLAVVKQQFHGDKQMIQRIEELLAEWKTFRDQTITFILAGQKEEAVARISGDGAELVNAIFAEIEELVVFARSSAESFTMNSVHESNTAILEIVIIVAASFIVSALIAFFIVRGITHSLRTIKEEVDLLSERGGDLTQEIQVENKDEIGDMARSLNRFIAGLRDIIDQVKRNSEGVSSASQQIAAASEEVASSSNEQAASAQTMNELFKELVSSIQAVAASAEAAADLSANTADVAKTGGEVIHSSIEGMKDISRHMDQLAQDSNKIGNIIAVIDEIAEQTNLLALNAAIEAARAGDQGRGFAVVADEVRKLAERSGEATKQITDIIRGMQKNTANSVEAVNDGMAKSNETQAAFSKILEMVMELSQKVSEIAAASEEQSAQSQEAVQSLETIAAASEQSAASAEESSSAAQSLAQMAGELQDVVAKFKV